MMQMEDGIEPYGISALESRWGIVPTSYCNATHVSIASNHVVNSVMDTF